MLMTKETIDQLAGYLGSTPIPEDFDTFWAARMAERAPSGVWIQTAGGDWQVKP